MDNVKMGHHISGQFDKDLDDIRNKVLTMGGLVELQIENAVQAFTTGDLELAEQVIKQDKEIDAYETSIDLECTQILALRQPTAFDLRFLLSVIKIIHELQRMAHKSVRVAEMAIRLEGGERKFPRYELEHMAELVIKMLHDSLDLFARLSVEGVTAITDKDSNVDREYDNILRQLITRMMEDPRNITRTLDVLWTVRALERIGDYSCFMCEHLVYMIKGQKVRLTKGEEL
ncbi:MAG: phosphate signaling complex protein PhoU [Methylovulum sp.]|jgi:phosphate transport system protein